MPGARVQAGRLMPPVCWPPITPTPVIKAALHRDYRLKAASSADSVIFLPQEVRYTPRGKSRPLWLILDLPLFTAF